jgi:hypothetical protein
VFEDYDINRSLNEVRPERDRGLLTDTQHVSGRAIPSTGSDGYEPQLFLLGYSRTALVTTSKAPGKKHLCLCLQISQLHEPWELLLVEGTGWSQPTSVEVLCYFLGVYDFGKSPKRPSLTFSSLNQT